MPAGVDTHPNLTRGALAMTTKIAGESLIVEFEESDANRDERGLREKIIRALNSLSSCRQVGVVLPPVPVVPEGFWGILVSIKKQFGTASILVCAASDSLHSKLRDLRLGEFLAR